MTAPTTTYELAAPQLADYVQPLAHGALAMPFEVRDDLGRPLRLDDDFIAGRSLVLVFVDPGSEAAAPALQELADRSAALAERGAACVVISADSHAERNRALIRHFGLACPVCGDSTGVVFASYGLHKLHGPPVRWVLLTPYRQIRAWYDAPQPPNAVLDALHRLLDDAAMTEAATWSVPHAPVLLVPNVLTREECAALITSFEAGSPLMVRRPRPGELDGNYRIPVYEHNRQDRVDEILKARETVQFLDERLFGRVVPMIKKAFGFDVTRREDLHIARYVGERGGNAMGHRDNVSAATAYRRFALSMNLNDDYDGGEVVFREFSDKGYKPEPGSALIFSSSLLHEVLETTRGTRYTLISHLFNEQSSSR
ncbi:MAG: 2OG-Fe(II) oxygenase [Pseudomonadota bacterium]